MSDNYLPGKIRKLREAHWWYRWYVWDWPDHHICSYGQPVGSRWKWLCKRRAAHMYWVWVDHA